MENEAPSAERNSERTWPWVVVVLLVLGVVLAVVWVRAEARRIHEQRQTDMPPSGGVVR
jgi:F0F1-type ATP synthase assembly protein I